MKTEVWAMDEHRLGLKPILRRMWVKLGTRPTACVHPRYEWVWVYAFVRPGHDDVTFVILPTVSCAMMSAALAEFAAEVGAGPHKCVLLVLDQAGFHVGKDLVIPEGIHLVFTPPYSPELQPAERIWPIIDEPLANRAPKNIQELENTLVARCQTLQSQPQLFAPHVAYHWWPIQ